MNKLRISKIGIDALRNEFSVLTGLMMRDVVGGNKCIGEAIFVAKEAMGLSMSQQAIDNQIIDYLVNQGAYPSRQTAKTAYESNGVNGSYINGILDNFFDSCSCCTNGCGGCGQTNTQDIIILSFALDNEGNSHAGIWQGDVTIGGKLYFKAKDKKGVTWTIAYEDVDKTSNLLSVCFIPKACDDDSGSGSGNSGSGSDDGNYCGSGSGDDNYCGSGSGWY